MKSPEALINKNLEAELPRQVLGRLERIPSENWHKITAHDDPDRYYGNQNYQLYGYETTLYLPGQAFKIRLESVLGKNPGFHKIMVVSKPESNISLTEYLQTSGSSPENDLIAQRLFDRLQDEVDPREDSEQKTKKRALQIDLESALNKASKMEK